MEKIIKSRVYTRDSRKQSEGGRWNLAITDHAVQSNNIIDWESAKIVTREGDTFKRGVKEAIIIRQNPHEHE